MIFVTLGTQDKAFGRLLEMIEKSNIQDEIIVQSGYTKFTSSKMKIFDYLDINEFNSYMEKADIIIGHGGVGTLLKAVELGKKVIAVPRLKKYGEHTNDHQLQICDVLSKEGYVITLNDGDSLDDTYKQIKEFVPKPYTSNNLNFVSKLKEYLEL